MRFPRRRGRTTVALFAVLALALAACGGDEGGDTPDGGDATGSETAAAGPFTIGVSNGFTGSEWRTQMIGDIEEVFAEYKDQGLVDELVIENDNMDEAGQIEQVRNLVNAGVDAIIINPNSPDALNAAFEEAAAEGVLIFAVDQAVTSDAVTNVVIDQSEWAKISARWLSDQLGEGASIVGVNGIAGHPANEARWTGATEVFEEAGIEVVTQANAD